MAAILDSVYIPGSEGHLYLIDLEGEAFEYDDFGQKKKANFVVQWGAWIYEDMTWGDSGYTAHLFETLEEAQGFLNNYLER